MESQSNYRLIPVRDYEGFREALIVRDMVGEATMKKSGNYKAVFEKLGKIEELIKKGNLYMKEDI